MFKTTGNNKIKIKFMIVLVLFLIVIVFAIVFHSVGRLLVVKDSLEKVDAIIVISGDQGERVRHSVKLFKNNLANHLILSGCSNRYHKGCAFNMRDQAISLGVPQENIILDVLKNHSLGTGTQGINIKKIMVEKGFKSAILVTSNYHTRRSKMIFKRAFKNNYVKILITYPDNESFNPICWWKKIDNINIVISELIKLIWYWITFSGGKLNT